MTEEKLKRANDLYHFTKTMQTEVKALEFFLEKPKGIEYRIDTGNFEIPFTILTIPTEVVKMVVKRRIKELEEQLEQYEKEFNEL